MLKFTETDEKCHEFAIVVITDRVNEIQQILNVISSFEISCKIRKYFDLIISYYTGGVLPQFLAACPHPGRVEPAGAGPGHAALRRGEGQEGGGLGHCQGLRHDR